MTGRCAGVDLDLIFFCIFLISYSKYIFLGNFINYSRQVTQFFYSSLSKWCSNVTHFSARAYFRDFGYPFLDVLYTCWQIWPESRPQLALNGRCPQRGYVLSWHQPCSPLPPLLKLRAVVGCVVLQPSAGAKQLFLFFYIKLCSKMYSPKIDLEKDKKKKKGETLFHI